MPVIKYRVHEVAKDFKIKSNSIIELLGKYFGDAKKHQTALESAELDVIFDTLTQQNSVESFDSYFAMEKPASEHPAEAEQAADAPEADTQPVAEEKKEAAKEEPRSEKGNKADKGDKQKHSEEKKGNVAQPNKPFEKKGEKKKDCPNDHSSQGWPV